MSVEDVAQDLELRHWEAVNMRRCDEPARYEPGDKRYGPADCCECGEPMPDVRRSYGFKVCVPCKTMAEAERRITRSP